MRGHSLVAALVSLFATAACSGGDTGSGVDEERDNDATSSGGNTASGSGGDDGLAEAGGSSGGTGSSEPVEGVPCGDGWGTALITGSLDLGLASAPEVAGVVGGTAEERAIFDQINVERENNGLAPLIFSEQVANVARSHAADMNQQGYFDHGSSTRPYRDEEGLTNRDNWLPLPRVDFLYPGHFSRAGENIASYPNPVEDVVEAWMNSDGHRAAILYDWATHGGIGLDGRMAVFSPAQCAE